MLIQHPTKFDALDYIFPVLTVITVFLLFFFHGLFYYLFCKSSIIRFSSYPADNHPGQFYPLLWLQLWLYVMTPKPKSVKTLDTHNNDLQAEISWIEHPYPYTITAKNVSFPHLLLDWNSWWKQLVDTIVHIPGYLLRARKSDLNCLGRGMLCFLPKQIQYEIPQLYSGVEGWGGMLPGLTHLWGLASFSWNAWPVTSHVCSERTRVHFLRGALVTLYPHPSKSTFLFTWLFISLSKIMDSSKSGIISYLRKSKNLSSQEYNSGDRVSWDKIS